MRWERHDKVPGHHLRVMDVLGSVSWYQIDRIKERHKKHHLQLPPQPHTSGASGGGRCPEKLRSAYNDEQALAKATEALPKKHILGQVTGNIPEVSTTSQGIAHVRVMTKLKNWCEFSQIGYPLGGSLAGRLAATDGMNESQWVQFEVSGT